MFPLPNVVLFPGTRIPLHIFEPRYRQMVSDAQRGEGLLGMVLLRRAVEGSEGATDIHSVACLGRMRGVQRLDDGRYLLTVAGMTRVHIESELPTQAPYRLARVRLLPDKSNDDKELAGFAEGILDTFNRVLKSLASLPGPLLCRHSVPPGMMLDVLASYLPSDPYLKQRLLEELDVRRRGRILQAILSELSRSITESSGARFRLFPRPSRN